MLEKYICCICGHTYDPSRGEPKQDIPPGTAFLSLPDDWQCPVCFAEKKNFKKE